MKRTTLYCSLLFLLFQSNVFGQEPSFHWMKKMEIIRAEDFYYEPIDHQITDSRGNIYRLMVFSEEVVLEDTTITAGIGNTFILIKHNSQGKREWVRKIVGFDEEEDTDWGWVSSLCLDPQENIVIGGNLWTTEVDFGDGKRLVNTCAPDYCENLFAATYSTQGKLIETVSFSLPEDNRASSSVLNIDAKGRKTFSFFTDAPELSIEGGKVELSNNANLVTVQLSSKNQLEYSSFVPISNGHFLPFNSVSQKDGSTFVFGSIGGFFNGDIGLSDHTGFNHRITRQPGEYGVFLLLKQQNKGKPEWALDITFEGVVCQMAADADGNVYLLGLFTGSLFVREEVLFENKDWRVDGFILKIGPDGQVIWKKQLENATIPVFGNSLVSAFPGSLSPEGGLLVPITAISDTHGKITKIDDREIQPSFEEFASTIAYFSPNGQLDTLITIKAEEGLLFGTSCRFDNKGRIYATFLAQAMDSLKVGAYRYAVENEYTEFLACFSLDKKLPGLNFPILGTKYDRDIRIRISPNPTSDKAELRWEPQETPASLILRDAVGRQLQVLKVEPLVMEASFDLSKHAPGVYYIEWQGKDTFHSTKVVKY